MSRIGKLPVELEDGVTVTLAGGDITVKGPKGTLSRKVPPLVKIEIDGKELRVQPASSDRRARAMHGLTRALVFNMVNGVTKGYVRELEINGVGYRAEARPGVVGLSLGYSHPIEVTLPEGVDAKVDKNKIILSGIDKEAVGQVAAIIRDQRPPEPYKGKGVKYVEETIRRKVGKAGAA